MRALADDPGSLATTAPDVSGWSVGRHIEHLRLAAAGIVRWIESTLDDPAGSPPSGSPSRTGRMVLLTGYIPRGRAKAPEPSVPGEEIPADLAARLDQLMEAVDRLEERLDEVHASESTFEHPILGHFTPRQWLRFLDVHHRHHEKIVSDIRASRA
ncbi:MAG: DinB family protein [Gemmatimonadota bacterium]|nr:DinB family protein [Gemmatimonadota bacterium]